MPASSLFLFSSRRRHTRWNCDWSSDVCSSDLGEPTGMLKEDAAMSLVKVRIPEPSLEKRRKGIELVLENVARNGVTSVQDFSDWADFQIYQQLKEEGKLTVRITEWLPFNLPLNDLQNMRAQGGTKDP